MTQPRLVLPGDTVMITRRTLRRHHLFRPDPAIRQLYLYTLAICARQFGILVHAITLMSTHEHLIVTDTKGRYPEFLRRLHRLVSLGTKVLRKWEGPTWLRDVSFSDGTAVGADGTILRTTDGGEMWTAQSSGTFSSLLGVSFSDANTGTAVGAYGTILRTTDGGSG